MKIKDTFKQDGSMSTGFYNLSSWPEKSPALKKAKPCIDGGTISTVLE